MPIFKNKVLAGNEFTGTTETDGFFDPATGQDALQVRVNSIRYHTEGGGNSVMLSAQNPNDPDDLTLILSQTAKDMYLDKYGASIVQAGIYTWCSPMMAKELPHGTDT